MLLFLYNVLRLNEDYILSQLVANYWKRALDKIPSLHFELYDVTYGVNSIAIYYKSVMNKKAIEVMFFDQNGKVNKMFAHYTE